MRAGKSLAAPDRQLCKWPDQTGDLKRCSASSEKPEEPLWFAAYMQITHIVTLESLAFFIDHLTICELSVAVEIKVTSSDSMVKANVHTHVSQEKENDSCCTFRVFTGLKEVTKAARKQSQLFRLRTDTFG